MGLCPERSPEKQRREDGSKMRLNNQRNFEEQKLATAIDQGDGVPVIQFSEPSAYEGAVLEQVNHLCERFGSKIQIRFYGHYGGEFDCRVLRQIPEVRWLGLDCLMHATSVEVLNELANLEGLTFGIFEVNLPKLLEMPAMAGLRVLVLEYSRKNNIDLAPLGAFQKLEVLTVSGHSRHIEGLARSSIKKLGLSRIRKSVPLDFVGCMANLELLSVRLGGRPSLDEVAHERLKQLEVMRVRGIENLDVRNFPSLRVLHIEDQPQIKTLNLEPIGGHLQRLKIFNCKRLRHLSGMELLGKLQYLWLGRTLLVPDSLIERLPRTLRAVSLCGYGTKRDSMLKERLRSLAYSEASYLE
jgi:hypothetical protein